MDLTEKYLGEASEHSSLKKGIKNILRKLEKATDDSGDKATIRGLENQAENFLDDIVHLSNKLKVKI